MTGRLRGGNLFPRRINVNSRNRVDVSGRCFVYARLRVSIFCIADNRFRVISMRRDRKIIIRFQRSSVDFDPSTFNFVLINSAGNERNRIGGT